ncbi:MAG: HEAT repeat domain-containing protein [Planctomycetota bacterium]
MRFTMVFREAPLRRILEVVSAQAGVDLRPDRAAQSVIDRAVVSLHFDNEPLGNVLQSLLVPHDLVYKRQGYVVEIALEPAFRARAVRENIEKLKDPDRMVRKQAVRELRALESAEAVPALIKALSDPDIDRKVSRALVMIGRAEPHDAARPLIGALRDPDARMRGLAALVLGQMRSREPVPALVQALADPDRRVRRSAARAIAKIGDRVATKALVGVLKDPDASVRTAAAEALGDIGDPAGVEPLAAMLNDTDSNVRYRAVGALGGIPGEASRRAVQSALKDDDADVREEAARILRPPADARDSFWREVQDGRTPRSRALAAIGLGVFGDQRAVGPLIDLLASTEKDFRFHAAQVLGELRDSSALPALRKALATEEEAEVLRAIRKAIPKIEKAQQTRVAPTE